MLPLACKITFLKLLIPTPHFVRGARPRLQFEKINFAGPKSRVNKNTRRICEGVFTKL